MKMLFDTVSHQCSKMVTQTYSTSFSLAVKLLSPPIRQDIYNIYGFVRLADEIVDTFYEYNREKLFADFEAELSKALENRISINPIINSFQHTVHRYGIENHLVAAFMNSMRADLTKKRYQNEAEYKTYIYGSADVVGLMCLKVFVKGDSENYNALKDSAMSLGSAFQKVNFLRDIKDDYQRLERTYFPNTDFNTLDDAAKQEIIAEIENDLSKGYEGIVKLPTEAKFGVYTAYRYYIKLLHKLKKTPPLHLKKARIRVPNYQKLGVLVRCYVRYKLNFI